MLPFQTTTKVRSLTLPLAQSLTHFHPNHKATLRLHTFPHHPPHPHRKTPQYPAPSPTAREPSLTTTSTSKPLQFIPPTVMRSFSDAAVISNPTPILANVRNANATQPGKFSALSTSVSSRGRGDGGSQGR